MGNRQWPANIPAKLVALQNRPRRRKVIARIEFVVADKLKDAAVKPVRARLGRCVEECSTAVVLGRVRTLLHAELLQGVDRSLNKCSTLVLLAHVHAIEQEGDRAAPDAADCVSIHDFGPNRQRIAGGGQQSRARRKLRQTEKTATVQGQVRQLLIRNHRSNRRGVGAQERRLGGHLNGCGGSADLQLQVFASILPYLQCDFVSGARGEAWSSHSQYVGAGRDRRNDVISVRVRNRGLGDVRSDVPCRYGGMRYHSTRRICNTSDESA